MSPQLAATYTISTAAPQSDMSGFACWDNARIVSATVIRAQDAANLGAEAVVVRSFVRAPEGPAVRTVSARTTSISEDVRVVFGRNKAAVALVQELSKFRPLKAGWDGEDALAPNDDAICDAVRFVAAAGHVPGLASRLEPTLNADGTVSLDIDDRVQATLMFKGDDTIVYAVVGAAPGKAEFLDDHIPGEVLALLRG